LKPLHDSIYSFLSSFSEDGTNDQLNPVRLMLEKFPNQEYHSVDLSSATDRLPVILQADLLTALGLPGES
jgi:hypothetical protein